MVKNPFDMSVSGLELMDWVWFHSHNTTSYSSLAKGLMNCFNLNADKNYIVKICDGVPVVTEVAKKGVNYEIPCDN